jgi:ferredoxin
MASIIIENLDNKKIPCNPAISLLNNILMSETEIETICGGRGRCGKCRIKILDKEKYVTPVKETEKHRLKHLIQEGWRLACQTYSLKDIRIYIPTPGSDEGIAEESNVE